MTSTNSFSHIIFFLAHYKVQKFLLLLPWALQAPPLTILTSSPYSRYSSSLHHVGHKHLPLPAWDLHTYSVILMSTIFFSHPVASYCYAKVSKQLFLQFWNLQVSSNVTPKSKNLICYSDIYKLLLLPTWDRKVLLSAVPRSSNSSFCHLETYMILLISHPEVYKLLLTSWCLQPTPFFQIKTHNLLLLSSWGPQPISPSFSFFHPEFQNLLLLPTWHLQTSLKVPLLCFLKIFSFIQCVM